MLLPIKLNVILSKILERGIKKFHIFMPNAVFFEFVRFNIFEKRMIKNPKQSKYAIFLTSRFLAFE